MRSAAPAIGCGKRHDTTASASRLGADLRKGEAVWSWEFSPLGYALANCGAFWVVNLNVVIHFQAGLGRYSKGTRTCVSNPGRCSRTEESVTLLIETHQSSSMSVPTRPNWTRAKCRWRWASWRAKRSLQTDAGRASRRDRHRDRIGGINTGLFNRNPCEQ